MTTRTMVNGDVDSAISPLDRGHAYGDGIFETILFVNGVAPFWLRHMARLRLGCERLGLPLPDVSTLSNECAQATTGIARAIVRISWTRGVGERGYAVSQPVLPTRVVVASAALPLPADWYRDGIRLRCCTLRLAAQPVLAGIKHCNRLEQVLARSEWSNPAIAEGLMFDVEDRVIGATAANVFALIDGKLATPALDRNGVAGVVRAEILANRAVQVRDISRTELMQADEIFLTSALRGVLPVAAIETRTFAIGAATRDLLAQWRTTMGENT
ncbi:MAG: aminodeoxychorismate lyase [Tahibacter sp.]